MIFDRAVNHKASNQARAPSGTTLTLSDAASWDTGTISESKSMKLSAVNACVEVLSNTISKLPVYVIDGNTKAKLKNHPLAHLLSVRPNEAMTPSVAKKLTHCNILLGGNGYQIIVRDSINARPRELIPVPYYSIEPFFDTSGKLWYLYTNPRTGEMRRLNQFDVLHYKAYSEDGITGISVLTRAQETISTARAAQRYENKFYSMNAQPSGVLTIDTSLAKEAKDKVRAEWERIHSGVDNSFRTAVLDLGMKYQPISISNKDAQFIESKAVTVEDISRFFGVPLYKLGAGKQSYDSNEQNGIEYISGTIHPYISQYEEEDSYKLLFDSELSRGMWIKRNMMAELRGDSESRGSWYRNMREIGAFSVNDIRDLEDMPDVEGGDARYARLNSVPLDQFAQLSDHRAETGGTT